MKLFKKVLAVVLVGAMAVSMLTACGSSKSSKVKDALKDFDIKMDPAMVQDTEKMMGGLQQLTEKVTSSTTERYPYLMKVKAAHVSKEGLKRLLQKEFVQKGEFSGNSEAVDILRSLLKGAGVEKAGVSVGKVYGKDVLLVTVPAGTTIPQTAAPKTLTT